MYVYIKILFYNMFEFDIFVYYKLPNFIYIQSLLLLIFYVRYFMYHIDFKINTYYN